MRRRLTAVRLAAVAVIAGSGLGVVGVSWGQISADGGTISTGNGELMVEGADSGRGGLTSGRGFEGGGGGMVDNGPNLSEEIRLAAEAYRKAEGDDAKRAAQGKLTVLLGKYFDQDMSRRQAEVKKVEDRLAKLRALLERRQAKKLEIVELQAKVVLNEAEGLGFYESTPLAGMTFGNAHLPVWNSTPSLEAPTSDADPFAQPAPVDNPLAAPTPTTSATPIPQ